MKKHFKKFFFAGAIILAIVGFSAFDNPSDKYFEIAKNLDIFATLFKEVNSAYVDDVSPNKLMKKGIDAMLESLDPYTNYIPEDEIEDYRTNMTGEYGGIGAVIGKKNDKPIILMPYEGFPANKAGLQIGDEILKVDGIAVTDKTTGDISKMLKGQVGKEVNLEIKRYGVEKPLELTFKREKIKLENVTYYGMVTNDIGYVRLTDFMSGASREVKKAISDLKDKGAKKIIFDLRDNPGGLLNEAINISNLFIEKDKLVVSTKGKISEWNKEYHALGSPLDTHMPMVVLTSNRSASASEIVSGVIQDYDRGVIVGQRSFGKGLVQTTRPLSYNSQLKVTIAKYYTPSGRCIQALDYSHRNEDGSVASIPDSLRNAFKTKNGRVVYDGGGISPDIEVKRNTLSPITASLINKGLMFDYSNIYTFNHKKIASAKDFKLTEEEYNAFLKWLKDKDYDYTTKVEGDLQELEANAKKEKYYDDIKSQIDNLRTQIGHNKEKDLQTFKAEISEELEKEIVAHYYLQKGVVEASFDNDEDVKAAVEVLNNKEEYKKILSGK